ncbi:MAG: hypothetical protein ACRDJ3_12345 [Solirubrobacteraceae bacterium]
MTDQIAFPPLHGLSPGELEMRKEHLLSEIGRESERTPLLLTSFLTPLRRSRVALGLRPILVAPIVLLAALALVPIGGASLGARAVDGISSLWGTPVNQPALDVAASDARAVAGTAYYTDAVVNDAANDVDVYLAHAPQSVIDRLQGVHPGSYVIHNDAAHPLSELLELQKSLDLSVLRAQGIDVVSTYPGRDGYLEVGVSKDVDAAQASLDAKYPDAIHVYSTQPATIAPHLIGG